MGRFILAYNFSHFQPSISTQRLVKPYGAYTHMVSRALENKEGQSRNWNNAWNLWPSKY